MSRTGGIKKIQSLFDKYTTLLKAPQSTVIQSTIEVIEDIIHFTVPNDRVTYTVHTKVLHISVAGPIKSEILLHKNEILMHLKGRLGPQNAPRDII